MEEIMFYDEGKALTFINKIIKFLAVIYVERRK